MDLTNVELPGATISSISVAGGDVCLHFESAILIKSMTGSDERTQWSQNMLLRFTEATWDSGDDIEFPAICAGGDIGENIYTYRDMIQVPLESKGVAHCDLAVEGSDTRIQVSAKGVILEREGQPKYLQHIR